MVLLRTLAAAALAAPLLTWAAPARVIVAFKPDAAVLQGPVRALSAETAARQAERLQRRADALAATAGVPLRAGRRVAEAWQVVQAEGLDSAALAARLARHPDVAWAVPDQRRRALRVPNDPLFPAVSDGSRPQGPDAGQWYLRAPDGTVRSAANVAAAWDRNAGEGVVVAILDTGVSPEHPDLQGRLLPGIDTIDDLLTANDGDGADTDPSDPGDWITAAEDRSGPFAGCGEGPSTWHGTQVATIAGARADDDVGMAGTAHGARILPVRVLGKCGGYDSDIVAGMLWAAGLERVAGVANAHPARVLNLSLGGPHDPASTDECTAYERAAARIAQEAGGLVVAAAGNGVGGAVGVPARCAGFLAVGGLRHAGSKVGFSDLGPQIALSAPGGNCVFDSDTQPCTYPILAGSNAGAQGPRGSTWTDSIDYGVGTSFASPIVAGAVAMVLSQRPALTPAELRQVLQATARPFPQDGATNLPLSSDPVPACRPPDGSEQLQCYCQTGLCGAGMLDAAAAVAASEGAFARIALRTASPVAGDTVTLDGSGSLPAVGRTVAGYAWRLIDGGGIVGGFSSASNVAQVSLLPSGAGTVTLGLTITDDQGATAQAQTTVVVAAAGGGGGGGGGSSGGGGGGAMGAGWLLALAAATALLARTGRGPRVRDSG
jgi:serine protease